MTDKKIPVVELFYSLQGEGLYTGRPSIFIRLFGCNFECNGFSNKDKDGNIGNIEIKQVDSIEELSNDDFTKGCDSRYSWHKDYEHLAKQLSPQQVIEECEKSLPRSIALNSVDIIFTGGEPLMNQKAILMIITELNNLGYCGDITFETNASLRLQRNLVDYINNEMKSKIHFSNSPKLSTSGEPRKKAWNPKALESQYQIDNADRSFKFVVGTEEEIEEVEEYLQYMQNHFDTEIQGDFPISFEVGYKNVFLMPVGATQEQQNQCLPFVADQCMQKGYSLSMRCHVYAFGNALGT